MLPAELKLAYERRVLRRELKQRPKTSDVASLVDVVDTLAADEFSELPLTGTVSKTQFEVNIVGHSWVTVR